VYLGPDERNIKLFFFSPDQKPNLVNFLYLRAYSKETGAIRIPEDHEMT
jgi:hypothetical protein